ncbi:MAG: 3-hydroxybutyrate dehydrogenase [Agarilytica sp.]
MSNEKVAIITGSTSGIGLACAEVMAEQGINIAFHGLMPDDEGNKLAADMAEKHGIKTLFDGANLGEPAAIEAFMKRVHDELGRIDILVNNAGIQHTETLEDFPDAKWDAIIAINLSSVFHTTKYAIPVMRKQGGGRIVNIASVHGLVASAKKSAYVAAKHGVVGLTKVTALENAEFGITANAICPGWVDTPILQAQIQAHADATGQSFEDAKRSIVTTKQPVPEMANPRKIGEFIMYLSGEHASTISGAALPIDGGWTAQ